MAAATQDALPKECLDFDRDIAALLESKLPVSASKIEHLTKAALKNYKNCQHIVNSIENFVTTCPPEYKIAGLYVIHALVTAKKGGPGSEYLSKFEERLKITFPHITHCVDKDWEKVQRVVKLWRKGMIFSNDILDELEKLPHVAPTKENHDDNAQNVTPTITNIEANDPNLLALVYAPPVLAMATSANIDPAQLAVALAQLLQQGGISNWQVATALTAASQPDQPNFRQAAILQALLVTWQQQQQLTANTPSTSTTSQDIETSKIPPTTVPIPQPASDARMTVEFDYGEDSDDESGTTSAAKRKAATPTQPTMPSLPVSVQGPPAISSQTEAVPTPANAADVIAAFWAKQQQEEQELQQQKQQQHGQAAQQETGTGGPNSNAPFPFWNPQQFPQGMPPMGMGVTPTWDQFMAFQHGFPNAGNAGPMAPFGPGNFMHANMQRIPPNDDSRRPDEHPGGPLEQNRGRGRGGYRGEEAQGGGEEWQGGFPSWGRGRGRGRGRGMEEERSPARGPAVPTKPGVDEFGRQLRDVPRDIDSGPHRPGGNGPANDNFADDDLVVVDPALDKNVIRVLSRTLYIGGIRDAVSEKQLESVFCQFGAVDTVMCNPEKNNAFVKMETRLSAIKARQMERALVDGVSLKVGWGCGFGPKDIFDYKLGESLVPLTRLTDADRRWLSNSRHGGFGNQPIVGGVIVEEPDVILGTGMASGAKWAGSGKGDGLPEVAETIGWNKGAGRGEWDRGRGRGMPSMAVGPVGRGRGRGFPREPNIEEWSGMPQSGNAHQGPNGGGGDPGFRGQQDNKGHESERDFDRFRDHEKDGGRSRDGPRLTGDRENKEPSNIPTFNPFLPGGMGMPWGPGRMPPPHMMPPQFMQGRPHGLPLGLPGAFNGRPPSLPMSKTPSPAVPPKNVPEGPSGWKRERPTPDEPLEKVPAVKKSRWDR